MNHNSDAHPSREVLAAFADGRDPGGNLHELEQHIAECSDCAATLTDIESHDNLARRVGAAVSSNPSQASSNSEVSLNFLESTQRPGALGRIGHYDVLDVLGRGGFGIVLRAFDDSLQRVVAVKVLASEYAVTSPARQRFLREARAAAAIRHENVVQIYSVYEQPLPYLVMEYIPGENLQERIDRTGPLAPAEARDIARQIAAGLAAAHARGLVHRDIKPANVLLENSGTSQVKITDFGMARTADDASLTQSGVVAGTPLYMSPEQARGEVIDHRTDLFSLGSVMYVMLSGRPPFRAPNTVAILKRVCDDTPRPIPEIIPGTPPSLCDIIGRLHAKDPEKRIQTARDVVERLSRTGSETPGLTTLANVTPAKTWPIRTPVAWGIGAGVIAVVLLSLFASGLLNGPAQKGLDKDNEAGAATSNQSVTEASPPAALDKTLEKGVTQEQPAKTAKKSEPKILSFIQGDENSATGAKEGTATWKIINRHLVGESNVSGTCKLELTKQAPSRFRLRFEARLTGLGNSGIDVTVFPVDGGLQIFHVELADQGSGSIAQVVGWKWLMKTNAAPSAIDRWTNIDIHVEGKSLTSFVDGQQMATVPIPEHNLTSLKLELDNRQGQTVLEVRKLELVEISESNSAVK